jgi:hypothetical protein
MKNRPISGFVFSGTWAFDRKLQESEAGTLWQQTFTDCKLIFPLTS